MCHSKTRKQSEAWNSLHSCRLMTVQPDSFWHCMCRMKMQNQNFKNFYSLLYSMLLLLNKKVVTSLSIVVEYADGNKRRRGKIARGAKNLTEITHKIFTPRAWGWQPLGRNWMGIITRTRFYGQYCVDSIRSLMNRDLAGFVWKTHHTSRHFQWISFSLLGISSLTARFAQFDWIFQPLDISESFIIMVNLSLPLRPLLSGCEQLVAPHPSLTLCVCVCKEDFQQNLWTRIQRWRWELHGSGDELWCIVRFLIWWNPFSVLPMTITVVALPLLWPEN